MNKLVENITVNTRLSTNLTLVAVGTLVIVLNLVPSESLSFDPWLCRSDIGTDNIRNYGWPIHVKTTFTEPIGGASDPRSLVNYAALLPNTMIAIAVILSPLFVLRWRTRHPKSRGSESAATLGNVNSRPLYR